MLPAVATNNQLANLDRFRIGDVPLFKAEAFRAKHHKLSIRRKRRRTRINCRNLKSNLQWLALDHRDREIVLRQKV